MLSEKKSTTIPPREREKRETTPKPSTLSTRLKRPCPVGEFVSLIDRDFRYVSINNKHAEAQNIPQEKMVGKTVAEVWGKETFDQVIERHLRECHGGKVVHYQSWFHFPKTGQRYWEVSYYPYREEGEEITHAMVVTRDLTEQKVATELLDLESTVLGSIVHNETLPKILTLLLQKVSRIVPHSLSIIRTFDSQNEVLRMEVSHAGLEKCDKILEPIGVGPDNGLAGKAAYTGKEIRVMERTDPLWESIQITSGDPPIRKAVAHPFHASNGILLGTLEVYYPEGCILQDYHSRVIEIAARTASLAVEKQICKEEQALLGRVVEQSGESIILTGTDGTIQYVNRAFEICTGYSKEEVLGKNISILVGGKQGFDEFQEMFLEALKKGDLWSGRSVNRRKDGSHYESEATVTRMCDSDGNTTSYIFIQRDITDRVNLENQLRHAQKMEAVGQLAGGVAHDFNNVLQAIYGSGELLLSSTTPGSRSHMDVQQILQSVDRGAKLVRQLLDLSRRNTTELQKIRLDCLVSDLLRMLKKLVRNQAELKFIPSSEPVDVWGDPGQIEQVILNLTMNARDAIADKKGVITIRVGQEIPRRGVQYYPEEPAPKPHALISIADTGTGIPEDIRHRIFEPFFTTKQNGEGTGLGLAIVFRILKDHHGFISLESTPGMGTRFDLFFPIVAEKEDRHGETASSSEGKSRAGGKTVLLAEDDS